VGGYSIERKPFKATHQTRFHFEPNGPDFEKGLARLKAAAEESERAAKDDAG
jgi:hypothetical protein